MLVKVPPGVSPGTTIQVQIPGENRMVSAQVPPEVSEFHVAYEPSQRNSVAMGQNQNSADRFGTNSNQKLNNNRNGYGGGMTETIQQSGIGTTQNYNNGYGRNNNQGDNNNNNNQGYNNSNNQRFKNNNPRIINDNQGYNNNDQGYSNNDRGSSGAIGCVAPVLAGAVLMGGAGYMIRQHNQHNNENNGDGTDYNDNGGGYDDSGDGRGYNDRGYDDGGGDGGFDDNGGGGDY